jgi:hypothetical protein
MSLANLQTKLANEKPQRFVAVIHGQPKSGKTSACVSLTKTDQTVAFLALDRNAVWGLKAGLENPKVPKNLDNLNKFHIKSVAALDKDGGLKGLSTLGQTLTNNSVKSLQALAASAPKKGAIDAISPIVAAIISSFVSDDGVDLGDITKWDSSYTLVIDSLSALVDAVALAINGASVIVAQSNYFAVQSTANLIIKAILSATSCNIIFITHSDISIDDNKVQTIFPKVYGSKGGLDLARLVTEVVYAACVGEKHTFYFKHPLAVCGSLLMPNATSMPQDLSLYYTKELTKYA